MSTTADLMGLGMSPALAERLGNTPATLAGAGTAQTGAAQLHTPVTLATPTGGQTAYLLTSTFSTGRPLYFWNTSATVTALVFPPSGGTINGGSANASVSVPPLSGALFQLENGSGVAAETWGAIIGSPTALGIGTALPKQVYNAVSTAPTTNNLNLTGANVSGGTDEVYLNLTATLSAGATATLPTVGALVTAMQAAGLNPLPGSSYMLYLYNTSSGNFAWTVTTNTGWTLTGNLTAAQNTFRQGLITFTSLTAATYQSLGEFAITAAI
jgi:hypothetical protein